MSALPPILLDELRSLLVPCVHSPTGVPTCQCDSTFTHGGRHAQNGSSVGGTSSGIVRLVSRSDDGAACRLSGGIHGCRITGFRYGIHGNHVTGSRYGIHGNHVTGVPGGIRSRRGGRRLLR